MTLNIQVITPDRVVWNTTTEEAIIPGIDGQIGILENHASLITNVDIGVLRIRTKNKWKPLILMGGCAEVTNNNIIILVNGVEEVKESDIQPLRLKLEEISNLLENAQTDLEKIALAEKAKRLAAKIVALTYL